jgi:hypothetical protein
LHTAGHLRLGCDQTDSLLASPFGLVIEGSVALKLAKKLCDPPLFSAGDEHLKSSGDSGFLGWLSAHAKGLIEEVLVESLSSWAPDATLVVWMALCDAQRWRQAANNGGTV